MLTRPHLAERVVAWWVELSEYDIRYEPIRTIKAQALPYFTADLVERNANNQRETEGAWVLSVDRSFNL